MRRASSPPEAPRGGRPAVILVAVLAAAALGVPGVCTAPAAAQGVTSAEIVLGISSAFKGPSAALGTELYRGFAAYVRKVNDEGGVHGRRIRLVVLDDGYDPPRAVRNSIRLIDEEKVFMLVGNVGTPTTVKVLPLLKKYENRQVYLFSPFTGAQPHRELPYSDWVWNLRASYRQETAGLVERLIAQNRRRIGVFYQSDSYGKSGQDGVRRALAERGLSIAAEATYARGARFEASMVPQVKLLTAAGVDAVVSIGSYGACAGFIRDARDAGFRGPVANISFVGAEAMLELLREYGTKVKKDYTADLVNSQVVPFHQRDDVPAAVEYRLLLAGGAPELPAELRDGNYRPARYSFGAFEGYLDARVLVEALRTAGPDLTPDSFRLAMESLAEFDAGLDVPVRFGPGRRQGLDRVYFTTVRDGQWVPY